MRVFVTGATGWIGSGVLRELREAGHEVLASARTPAAAEALTRAGATPVACALSDLAALRTAASSVDGVIHCAFDHHFSVLDGVGAMLVGITGRPSFARWSPAGGGDLRAIEAMLEGLSLGASPHKAFVCTSPIAGLTAGRVGKESDALDPKAFGAIRIASEHATVAATRLGVRGASIRLPPSVHGAGDTGFVPTLMRAARKSGVSTYFGNGENRWAAVHRDDAAALYRLTLEGLARGTVPSGSVLHGVAEEGVPFRAIAQAVADRLGIDRVEPRGRNGMPLFVGMVAKLDIAASSSTTQELTGWRPSRPGLLEDIRSEAYAERTTPDRR